LTRAYQQILVILSLPAVIGSLLIFKFFKKKHLRIFSVLIIFIFYFLFLSDFIPQVVGGTYSPMQLNNYGNGYDEWYVHKTEVNSAGWLLKESDDKDLIYVDVRAVSRTLLLTGKSNNEIINIILPQTIDKKAYVYSGYINTVKKRGFVSVQGDIISYNFPTEFLNQNKNKIYNNGDSEVYK
jgi:uncharacterized membrane protein